MRAGDPCPQGRFPLVRPASLRFRKRPDPRGREVITALRSLRDHSARIQGGFQHGNMTSSRAQPDSGSPQVSERTYVADMQAARAGRWMSLDKHRFTIVASVAPPAACIDVS